MEYLVFSVLQALILPCIHKIFIQDAHYELMDFYYVAITKSLVFYVFVFALLEKIKKEQFVISHTHSKTKKILMQLIN